MPAGWPLILKPDVWTLDIRFRQLRSLQPLHFLLARRNLRRPCARRKPRDEFVQLRDLLFALRVARFHARADLRFRQHHFVICAGVGDDAFVIDIRRVSADFVQKMPVVGNHEKATWICQEVSLQPMHRIQIEVVGGLVQ